jgi:GNAT superfamily N-acetyltransferase
VDEAVRELIFRTAHANDSEFVFSVKKAAFREYVEKVWGWDDSYQRELHDRRFASQDLRVIHLGDVDVGFLAAFRTSNMLKVNQLFILPEYQGRGIGSACMTRIVGEARLVHKPVVLQVLKVNVRGIAFYRRLGFAVVGESATHLQMEKPPDSTGD